MKKRLFLLTLIVFILSFSGIAMAENNVSQMNIDVLICDDGSANVTQIWDGNFDDGTENYIPINTDGIEITDFSVSDKNGRYQLIDNWDIDASFNEKKNKCGINETDNGIELCFGITNYGQNTYEISYTIHNFINSYTDFDGTNFMLVNPNMNTFPTNVNVNISMLNGKALTNENAKIWGFGYEGNIVFNNGKINAYTTSPLDNDNKVIVMIQLNKGQIYPANIINNSFEEVRNEAMEGANFNGNDDGSNDWLGYIFMLFVLIGIIIVILIVVSVIKRKREIKKFYNDAPYFRDIPCNENWDETYFISNNFDVLDDDNNIIGATILKLINNSNIEPKTEEKIGFFGNRKSEISLRLIKEPTDETEKKIYEILTAAAGNDKILQEKELEKYVEKHPDVLEEFKNNALVRGENLFTKNGGFFDRSGNKIKDLSEIGKEKLTAVMGLKKFLIDYSLINEREIIEGAIWQDYLVFATLIGIAEKTLKQFKEIYPENVAQFEAYDRNLFVAYAINRSIVDAVSTAAASGGGGMSSLGGGGGFSGGGFGGGSR